MTTTSMTTMATMVRRGALVAALGLAACAHRPSREPTIATVTGTPSSRERIALPAQAIVGGGLAVPLEDTYWRLAAIGASPVTAAAGREAPSITLQSADHRVTGSGGCNRLAGGYTLSASSLTFTPIIMTRMACAEGMETETAFGRVFEAVRAWRVSGDALELLDAGGAVLARFVARAMP